MSGTAVTPYTSTLRNMSVEELVNWGDINIAQSGGSGTFNSWIDYVNNSQYAPVDYISEAERWAETSGVNFFQNGDGTYTITGFQDLAQTTSTTYPNNSNSTTIGRSATQVAVDTSIDSQTGNVTVSNKPSSGSFGQNAMYFLNSLNQATFAAQVGIFLGRTIDSALYNANPDYWDSIGLSSLNPDTWSSITNGDNSLAAGLFNMILGINPDTNQAQMYMNANALAYGALALHGADWFNDSNHEFIEPSTFNLNHPIVATVNPPAEVHVVNNIEYYFWPNEIFSDNYAFYIAIPADRFDANITMWSMTKLYASDGKPYYVYAYNGDPGNVRQGQFLNNEYSIVGSYNRTSYTNQDKTVYYNSRSIRDTSYTVLPYAESATQPPNNNLSRQIAWTIIYGDSTSYDVDGLGWQPNATKPDTSNWSDLATTDASLREQYPNVYNNSIVYNQVQPDGTTVPTEYIPVPFVRPNPTPAPNTDPNTQPVSDPDSSSQAQPAVDLDTLTDALTAVLTEFLTQPQTDTQTDTTTPPQNPPDTGTGDSPVPTAPTGSASALWSVYHPTQTQINSFGSWLWGSPFLTDIGKLFQNPIDGVISLHKIFAPPVDSGTGTIVVGTLDSNVSSATVTQQYVTVDCGYIDCHEQFGNVFDYPPYTQVSLYLPFIGIVPLSTDDVMRSTLHVVYGVDVFTGACLAMVEVTRDGNTVNMYQHAGVCSVQYPLSNVQNSQMISGLLSVAAGVASIATAGTASAAIGGALAVSGGAASAARSSVGRSGGFSGNAGAMGIKKPYLILQRPQTKVAKTFPRIEGYPTNYSTTLGDCSGYVKVRSVHVNGINATDGELQEIENMLKAGVIV